jgi:hypothetical protein
MTRDEAQALCAKNAAEHPDRETAQWRPQELEDGTWTVVKVGIAPLPELSEETVAAEKPPTPDDPRDAHSRNAGEWAGPGI